MLLHFCKLVTVKCLDLKSRVEFKDKIQINSDKLEISFIIIYVVYNILNDIEYFYE